MSEGIIITGEITRISLTSTPHKGYPAEHSIPSIILFDSLDARIHTEEKNITRLLYFEYGEIRFDGSTVCKGARKIRENKTANPDAVSSSNAGTDYEIEAVKVSDHLLIKLMSDTETSEITIALPDSSRWAYIGLTGEHCSISNVTISRDDEEVPDGYIKRIAEKISYINVPDGDVPNIQSDGFRTDSTDGIILNDGHTLNISFHSMSLPTARLVWHCPYFSIFSSGNSRINGPEFREYGLVRLDGETWDSDEFGSNKIMINKTEEFISWDAWKSKNKEGIDVSVTITRSGNTVTLTTSNAGIELTNITTVKDDPKEIYISLAGDQCAITNIRIKES